MFLFSRPTTVSSSILPLATLALAIGPLAPTLRADAPATQGGALPAKPGANVSGPNVSGAGGTGAASEGEWKTAFYKRGFLGQFDVSGAGGAGGTIRSRVVLPFAGTKVRIYVGPLREAETVASKMSLARGKEGEAAGTISLPALPLTFNGAAGTTIEANGKRAISDIVEASIQPGIWYLQQSYSSKKISYAYHVDGFSSGSGDQHNEPKLPRPAGGGVWPGNVYRIDVWTRDARPTVLCYGDSITFGFNSTPGAGKSYPEILGRLVNRPTLNLGLSNDVIIYTGDTPGIIKECKGVDTVILLMGINDIFRHTVRTTADYSKAARPLIQNLKAQGKKVYIGTITPSGGVPLYDKTPAREELRQSINAWIREKAAADGVIDFDLALRDPQTPGKLRAEYQSDWLHPNDAGYQKMAETAAAALQQTP